LSIRELIYLLKVGEELREDCAGTEVGEEVRWAEVGEEQRGRRGWGGVASASRLGTSSTSPRSGRRMRRPELREECAALGEP